MTTWLSQVFQAFSRPFKWWVVIAQWERGVRVRTGKHVRLLVPGIHFRIPFLDRVFAQSIRLRTITSSNQTISTKDGHAVVVSYVLRFCIADILRLYNTLANPETTLRGLVESKIAEYISTCEKDDLSCVQLEATTNRAIEGFKRHGLSEVHCSITDYVEGMRVFRFMHNDYAMGASLHDLDGENSGERK